MEGTAVRLCTWALLLVLALLTEATKAPNHNHINSICSTWGKDHFKTFDGDVYQYPGTCEYNLASDCHESFLEFSVHMKRAPVDGHPTINRVVVTIKDLIVTLTKNLVTVNGEKVVMPYYGAGVLLERNPTYMRLSAKLGLTVMWNEEDAIMVELESKYANRTCGLCGDFNGIPVYDEFFRGGRQISAIEFGNQQKVHLSTEYCENPPEEEEEQEEEEEEGSTTDACASFVEHCAQLFHSDSWSSCAATLNPEPYIQACAQDMCSCGDHLDDFCLCSTLAEYSRQCSHAGGAPPNWRTSSFCVKTCPYNMVYSESGSPCLNTCTHRDTSSRCEEHTMDGCFCPEGTVLDDISERGCIPQDQCQCFHGMAYDSGEVLRLEREECMCHHGMWSCESLRIPGVCAIEEGSHVTTYDGKTYTFHGDCYYVFSKDCEGSKFTVLGQLVPCGVQDTDTCLKSVVVLLNNDRSNALVFKSDGKVSHNAEISLPYSTADLTVFRPSTFHILLQTNFGLQLQVQLVPVMQLYVTMDQAYQGKTCGLCGNFNMALNDDLKTPQGLVEGTASSFANSWKAQGSCPDKTDRLDDPCSLSMENENYAEHWCSLLRNKDSKFARCHAMVDPDSYYKRCKYSSCNCERSQDCLCAVFSSYVRACTAKNITLQDWRTNICDKYTESCPASQIFSDYLQGCQPTCRSLSSDRQSCSPDFLPVDGCSCPEGLYQDHMGHCVQMAKCPCYHNGEHVKPGKSINIKNEHCVCNNGKLHCHSWKRGVIACPEPKVFFNCSTANPTEMGLVCARTCKNLDLECFFDECESGCICPSGFLDDGSGKCVREQDCPCFHDGKIYASGTRLPSKCNMCTCKGGKWDCTKNKCPATCTIYGSGHHSTFDERNFGFRGQCGYVAVQDKCGNKTDKGNFGVITENIPCGTTGTTCSKSVRIFLGRTEVKLAEGTYEEIALKEGPVVKYTVRTLGLYLAVESGLGLTVLWDRKTTVRIILQPEHMGEVCGLCGDYDGDGMNDFKTQSQLPVGSPLEFANSWKISSTCPDAGADLDPCSLKPHRHTWAKLQCSIIKGKTFEKCHEKLNPQPYYDNCVMDSCACDTGGDCECFCTAVAFYAQACNEAGVCVAWRTPDICPVFCDYYNKPKPEECKWHYRPCHKPCYKTCYNPDGICINPIPILEGCYPVCPPDKPIFDNDTNTCVEDCPGCFINGTYYKPGDEVSTEEKCTLCFCDGNASVNCTRKTDCCFYNGTEYNENDIIYDVSDNMGMCYYAICKNGSVVHNNQSCSTPSTATTTTTTTTTEPPTPSTTTTTTEQPTPSTTTTTKPPTPSTTTTTTTTTTEPPTPSTSTTTEQPTPSTTTTTKPPTPTTTTTTTTTTTEPPTPSTTTEPPTPSTTTTTTTTTTEPPTPSTSTTTEQPTPSTTTTTKPPTPTTTTTTTTTTTEPPTPSTTTEPPTTTSTTTTTTTEQPTPSTTTEPPTPSTTTTTTEQPTPSTTTEPPTPSTTTTTTEPPTPTTTTTTTTTTTEPPTPSTTTTSYPTTPCITECEWSDWYDEDKPSGTKGDWETYDKITASGKHICRNPEDIECKSTDNPEISLEDFVANTGQNVHCNLSFGLICKKEEQTVRPYKCFNYKIRVFCCIPCPSTTTTTEPPTPSTTTITTTTTTTTTELPTPSTTTTTKPPTPPTTTTAKPPTPSTTTTTTEPPTPTTTTTTTTFTESPTTTTTEIPTPSTTTTTTTTTTKEPPTPSTTTTTTELSTPSTTTTTSTTTEPPTQSTTTTTEPPTPSTTTTTTQPPTPSTTTTEPPTPSTTTTTQPPTPPTTTTAKPPTPSTTTTTTEPPTPSTTTTTTTTTTKEPPTPSTTTTTTELSTPSTTTTTSTTTEPPTQSTTTTTEPPTPSTTTTTTQPPSTTTTEPPTPSTTTTTEPPTPPTTTTAKPPTPSTTTTTTEPPTPTTTTTTTTTTEPPSPSTTTTTEPPTPSTTTTTAEPPTPTTTTTTTTEPPTPSTTTTTEPPTPPTTTTAKPPTPSTTTTTTEPPTPTTTTTTTTTTEPPSPSTTTTTEPPTPSTTTTTAEPPTPTTTTTTTTTTEPPTPSTTTTTEPPTPTTTTTTTTSTESPTTTTTEIPTPSTTTTTTTTTTKEPPTPSTTTTTTELSTPSTTTTTSTTTEPPTQSTTTTTEPPTPSTTTTTTQPPTPSTTTTEPPTPSTTTTTQPPTPTTTTKPPTPSTTTTTTEPPTPSTTTTTKPPSPSTTTTTTEPPAPTTTTTTTTTTTEPPTPSTTTEPPTTTSTTTTTTTEPPTPSTTTTTTEPPTTTTTTTELPTPSTTTTTTTTTELPTPSTTTTTEPPTPSTTTTTEPPTPSTTTTTESPTPTTTTKPPTPSTTTTTTEPPTPSTTTTTTEPPTPSTTTTTKPPSPSTTTTTTEPPTPTTTTTTTTTTTEPPTPSTTTEPPTTTSTTTTTTTEPPTPSTTTTTTEPPTTTTTTTELPTPSTTTTTTTTTELPTPSTTTTTEPPTPSTTTTTEPPTPSTTTTTTEPPTPSTTTTTESPTPTTTTKPPTPSTTTTTTEPPTPSTTTTTTEPPTPSTTTTTKPPSPSTTTTTTEPPTPTTTTTTTTTTTEPPTPSTTTEPPTTTSTTTTTTTEPPTPSTTTTTTEPPTTTTTTTELPTPSTTTTTTTTTTTEGPTPSTTTTTKPPMPSTTTEPPTTTTEPPTPSTTTTTTTTTTSEPPSPSTTTAGIQTGPSPTKPTPGELIEETTTTETSTPCSCEFSGKHYKPGDTILNMTNIGAGICLTIICSDTCEIKNSTDFCISTPTPTPTPTPDCPEWDKMQNETFIVCNCTLARCIENNIIEIIPYECPPPKEITCANNKKPVLVYDEHYCCQHYVCDCYCEGWGDPHYITFDGLFYSFQGNCTYVLMEEKTPKYHVKIYIDNVSCDPEEEVSCPRSIIVSYGTQVITLKNHNVIGTVKMEAIVDEVAVKLPYSHKGVKVLHTGLSLVLEIPFVQVVVTFGVTGFSVGLPFKLFGENTQGQCGTCNNNQADDCMLPNGQLVENCAVMGDSWLATDFHRPDCIVPPTVPSLPVPEVTSKPCTSDSICDMLNSSMFAQCHDLISPENFYKGCVFDSCHMSNPTVECTSLQSYAAACAQVGVCIYWRNYTTKCAANCPVDKVYNPCGPVEQPTCNEPDEPIYKIVMEGCFCPDGMKLFSKESNICVEKCGCLDPDGGSREFDEEFEYNCQDCVCETSTKTVKCRPKACPAPTLTSCSEPGFILVNETNPSDHCCPILICRCDGSTCPEKDISCPVGYMPQVSVPSGKCCAEHTCVAKKVCVHKDVEYQPGATVMMVGCQNCTCTTEVDPKSKLYKIQCSLLICNQNCKPGYVYTEVSEDECCGKCIQTRCIIDVDGSTHLLKHGETWSPPDNKCQLYGCMNIAGTFISTISTIQCPPFYEENCRPGTIQTAADGCCKVCVEKERACKVESRKIHILHGDCQSATQVEMNYCQGACNTFSKYSHEASVMMHTCTCCQESRTSNRTVNLQCPNGELVPYSYVHVEECSCNPTHCLDVGAAQFLPLTDQE